MRSERGLFARRDQEDQRESVRELLSDLAIESAALVRDEIALTKQEIKEQAGSLRSGLVIVLIGAIIGALALMALCAAAIIGLGDTIGYALSALIVAIFLGIVAGVVISTGLVHAKQALAALQHDLQSNLPSKKSEEGLIHG